MKIKEKLKNEKGISGITIVLYMVIAILVVIILWALFSFIGNSTKTLKEMRERGKKQEQLLDQFGTVVFIEDKIS